MIKFLVLLCVCLIRIDARIKDDRSFVVDYENDQFLKDGQHFRYISGSLHYFRVPNQYWEDRLQKYKKAGLNTVQTYIEWSLHEPIKGKYDFEGDNDLFRFIELAQKNDLLVILRPGPYICAERENGGIPYWIKQLNLNTKVRTADRNFMEHVEDFWDYLMPKLKNYLYKNGGPVIMMQIENEYGSYYACDFNYQIQLKNLINKHLNNEVVLFTTDGYGDNYFKCGKIAGVLPAIDFGTTVNPDDAFKVLRNHLPKGPLINNEFYPGWLDHWNEPHQKISSYATIKSLEKILARNASVNFYMFFGGTNFGFWAGANSNDGIEYQPQPTSYDYDAPINEFGNITNKYFDIRNTISLYEDVGEITDQDYVKIIVPPTLELSLLNRDLIAILLQQQPKVSDQTLTFETLGVQFGFVLYKTTIDFKPTIPAKLTIKDLKDRAYVYVDNTFQGILSRAEKIDSISVVAKRNSELMILVENQGRVNFASLTGETKGIGSVSLGKKKLDGKWLHYGSDNWNQILRQINSLEYEGQKENNKQYRPRFFKGEFNLDEEPKDALLDLSGWSKGVAFINGKNLGRYWPVAGPQITTYVPGVWMKKGRNVIVLLEQEEDNNCSKNCTVSFSAEHKIDSETAYMNEILSFK